MSKRAKPGRVEVRWYDHVFVQGPLGKKRSPTLLRSVGYLVKQNDVQVVLAQSIGIGGKPAECLHLMTNCIVDITPLG